MSKRFRQYFGILAAVISYYIIHEGAHLLVALYYGVFKGINFMGLGMQIDVYAERLTDTQLGLFCLAGPVATLLFGWVVILLAKRICTSKSKLFKAIMNPNAIVYTCLFKQVNNLEFDGGSYGI